MASAKSKGKAEAKSKGKAKAKGKAEAKAIPGPLPISTTRGKGVAKGLSSDLQPKQPKKAKQPPIHYLSCTIYSDSTAKCWRAIERSNRRHDVKFAWAKADSWERCVTWCKEAASAAAL